MAAKKVVELQVLLKAAGIKATTAQVEKLTNNLKKLSTNKSKVTQTTKNLNLEQNKLKRNLEGVAQRAGSTGKDFSRMQQGMGGLVQAYATVAANVFALSSAFLVLRRSADLSSMIKSAENFSDRFGVSVTEITRRMQEASGGALDFAEALPSINKAVSAGIGIEQIEQLTTAATKAAQTFGGTTTEALSRFISAAQRGRVEIIQTLGVVIKTEQAYKDYAATIGKTALELTAFDRQQAIINATIEESQKVFDGVVIDPNPFQQLLTTVVDLKDNIATFITDALTPLISSFNQSKAAAAALITLIISSVGGRIFPEISRVIQGFQASSIQSTVAAKNAIIAAKGQETKLLLEIEQNVNKLTNKQLKRRSLLFREFYAEVLTLNKSFGKKLIDQNGQINAAVLTEQRAAVARELAARERGTGKGLQKAFVGVSDRALINESNRLTLLARNTQGAAVAQRKLETATAATNERFKVFFATTKAGFTKLKTDITIARSSLVTGFSKSFASMQTNVVVSIRAMNLEWLRFIRNIRGGQAVSALEAFSRAFGRAAGVITGGLARLLSLASTLTLTISGAILVWELFGKKAFNAIFNISEEQEKLSEEFESLSEALSEITGRTNDYVNSTDFATQSVSLFVKRLEFLRGTLDSTLTSFTDFNKSITRAFGGKRIQEIFDNYLRNLKNIAIFQEKISEINLATITEQQAAASRGNTVRAPQLDTSLSMQLEAANAGLEVFSKELGISNETFENIVNVSAPKLVEAFISINNLLKTQNIELLNEAGLREFETSITKLTDKSKDLATALKFGAGDTFLKILNEIPNVTARALIIAKLQAAYEKYGATLLDVSNQQIAAGRSLIDLNSRVDNFVSGIDKLRAASVPNKEIVNFIIDARTALQTLSDTAKEAGNATNVVSNVLQSDQLKTLQQFFDFEVGDSLEVALGKVNAQFKIFKGLVEENINANNQLKIVATQLKTLKEEEADSDKRRITIIEQINARKLEQESINKRILENNEKLLKAELATLENTGAGNSDRVNQLRGQLTILRAQIAASEDLLHTLVLNKDVEKERIKIQQESLTASKAVNNFRLQSLQINAKLSKTDKENLNLTKEIFLSRQLSLKIREQEIELEIKALKFNEKTFEQDEKRRAALNSELVLLRAKTAELNRQRLILDATISEQAGITIFDREGLELAAKFFVRKIRDEARSLKTTFQILGEGFVGVINDTFDTMVDNLLEGGKDFGRTVVETIKAGLRDVFGEAFKTKIREAFAKLFTGETTNKDPNEPLIESNTKLNTGILSLNDSIIGLNSNINKLKPEEAPESTILNSFENVNLNKSNNSEFSILRDSLNILNSNINNLTPNVIDEGVKDPFSDLNKVFSDILKENRKTNNSIESLANTETMIETTSSTPANPLENLDSVFSGVIKAEIPTAETILKDIVTASKENTSATKEGFFSTIQTLFQIITAVVSAGASKIGGFFQTLFGAQGGMLPGRTPLAQFAEGGITRRPQLAVIGEGKTNEAVVPLPNNREIPVDLKGATGDTINIEQNFDFSNATPSAIPLLRQEAKAIEDRTFNRVFSEINKGGRFARMTGRR